MMYSQCLRAVATLFLKKGANMSTITSSKMTPAQAEELVKYLGAMCGDGPKAQTWLLTYNKDLKYIPAKMIIAGRVEDVIIYLKYFCRSL